MNIGIIVYSQTGNTYAVAQELKKGLDAAGYLVSIESVTIIGETHPGDKNIQLNNIPAVDQYDLLPAFPEFITRVDPLLVLCRFLPASW